MPHQILQAFVDQRVIQSQGAADPIPDQEATVEDLHDGKGGDGKIVAAQLEAGITDDYCDNGRQDHADQYTRPRQSAIGNNSHSRTVCPDAEEHRVAKGYLAAITADDVPRLGHTGKE